MDTMERSSKGRLACDLDLDRSTATAHNRRMREQRESAAAAAAVWRAQAARHPDTMPAGWQAKVARLDDRATV